MKGFGQRFSIWMGCSALLVAVLLPAPVRAAGMDPSQAMQMACGAMGGAGGAAGAAGGAAGGATGGAMSAVMSMLCKLDWKKLLGGGGSDGGSGGGAAGGTPTPTVDPNQQYQQAANDWQAGYSEGVRVCQLPTGSLAPPMNPYSSAAYQEGYAYGMQTCGNPTAPNTSNPQTSGGTGAGGSYVQSSVYGAAKTAGAYAPTMDYYSVGSSGDYGNGGMSGAYNDAYAANQTAAYGSGSGYYPSNAYTGSYSTGGGAGIDISGPNAADSGAVRIGCEQEGMPQKLGSGDWNMADGNGMPTDGEWANIWKRGFMDGRAGLEPVTEHVVYMRGYMRGMMANGRVMAAAF